MTFTIQTDDLYNTCVRLSTFSRVKDPFRHKYYREPSADIVYAIRIHYRGNAILSEV